MICQGCGMEVEPGEYHPAPYCKLYQDGIDPKLMEQEIVRRATEDLQAEVERLRAEWHPDDDYLTALQVETVRAFVERVNRRAEEKMAQTGKLEGSHYAAMQIELGAMTGRD